MENNHENKASEILREIGVPCHLKGFEYIKYAVLLIDSDKKKYSKITKSLYPAVAERFDTSESKAARAIYVAIEKAFDNASAKVIDKIFGNSYSSDKGKPTNSEFLFTVAEYLKCSVEAESDE